MKSLNILKPYINTDYAGYGKLVNTTIVYYNTILVTLKYVDIKGLMIEITVIPRYKNLNNYIVDLLKSNNKIKIELALNLLN
jgi:hypothetical protein